MEQAFSRKRRCRLHCSACCTRARVVCCLSWRQPACNTWFPLPSVCSLYLCIPWVLLVICSFFLSLSQVGKDNRPAVLRVNQSL